MKKGINILGLLMIFAGAFSSCNMDENDNFGQGKIWFGYTTVEKENESDREFRLILDDGTVMDIVQFNANLAPDVYNLKDGDRIFAYFSIDFEDRRDERLYYYIRLNAYQKILTKFPVYNSEVGEEEVGEDPINVDKSWIGGGFLNVEFHFFAGSKEQKHLVSLYVIEDHPQADENNIYVEMRHNAYGDRPHDVAYGAVSFDIRDFLPQEKNVVTVHFTYTNYDGRTITTSEAYSRKIVEQRTGGARHFQMGYIY